LKNTQWRRDFKGGVAFGVAKNFCSVLALTLIICCYWPRWGNVLGTRKEGGKGPGRGEMSEGGNVRGWQAQGVNVRLSVISYSEVRGGSPPTIRHQLCYFLLSPGASTYQGSGRPWR